MSPSQQTSQLPEPTAPGGRHENPVPGPSRREKPQEGGPAGKPPDVNEAPLPAPAGTAPRSGAVPEPDAVPQNRQEHRCIEVCVGSSCFLKGAQEIITQLQKLIEEHHLADVTLKGRFCMERCTEGVTVKVGEKIISGLRPSDVPALFRNEVLRAPIEAAEVKRRG